MIAGPRGRIGRWRLPLWRWLVAASLVLALSAILNGYARGAGPTGGYYLPSREDSRIVTVTKSGSASAGITVITQAVAERESENSSQTCQIYAFVPSFIAVRRDEPTQISFRNYQADDDHDFMLVGPDSSKVLMFVLLPRLRETSYVFTFHEEGLFRIYCTMHQPSMSGQILVLPPAGRPANASSVPLPQVPTIAPSESFETAAKAALSEPKLPDCHVWGRQLEEELSEALQKKNWDVVAKLFSPSFQSAAAEGVRDRAAEIALLRSRDFTPHAVGFRVTYSGDVAILTYQSYHYERDPSGTPERKASRVLSVWRMTNAGWQQIARAEIPLVPRPRGNGP
jgi:plastocyanin/ketosteroid isomerase-like protein